MAARMSASSSFPAAASALSCPIHTGGSLKDPLLVLPGCCHTCNGCWRCCSGWGAAAPGNVGQSPSLTRLAGALLVVLPQVAAPLLRPQPRCADVADNAACRLLLPPPLVVLLLSGPLLLAESLPAALLAVLLAPRPARAAAADARSCCKFSLAATSLVTPVLVVALVQAALMVVEPCADGSGFVGGSCLAGTTGFAESAPACGSGGLGALGAAAAGCLGRGAGVAGGGCFCWRCGFCGLISSASIIRPVQAGLMAHFCGLRCTVLQRASKSKNEKHNTAANACVSSPSR